MSEHGPQVGLFFHLNPFLVRSTAPRGQGTSLLNKQAGVLRTILCSLREIVLFSSKMELAIPNDAQ